MPEKPQSFLASVKDEVMQLFGSSYDELAEVCTDETKLGETLKTLSKSVWDVMERRLKESYLNGKKATNGKLPDTERRPNPFRR